MTDEEALLQELLEAHPTRRRALELIVGGALAALAAGSAIPMAGYLTAPVRTSQPGGGRLLVGDLRDLPPGAAIKVTYEDRPALVLNVAGTVKAFSAICTHLGCVVFWNQDSQFIQCPCHDGRFDTNGQVISGPPPAPLPAIPVAVGDERIYLGSA
ncbi:MAG: Rieske 2Fe-2S domain-containing protein [Gemmatimonadetes bacterium]|nr:Rieske 2Fe-2S domain-containing protein [Gemmatimonadota bacterium]